MEYLAPGVYVEEVPSGNKPIEGASTSTAGVVGVTQRGPVNTPTLVTSIGEFNRVFGGLLDHRTFTEGRDALPYAMQGFFNNGGQRVYVSRIIGPNAAFAEIDIYAEPDSGAATLQLSARAAAGSSSLVVADPLSIADTDQLLLVDDVRSEYVTVSGAPATNNDIVLSAPLRTLVADASSVTEVTVSLDTDLTGVINGDMTAGGGLDLSDSTALSAGDIVEIADTLDPSVTEFVTITGDAAVLFDEGTLLFDHPQLTTTVRIVSLAAGAVTASSAEANAGATILTLADPTAFVAGEFLQLASGEIYQVSSNPITITLGSPLTASHAAGVSVIKQVPMLRVHARYQGLWGNQLRARIRRTSVLETATTNTANIGDTAVVLDAVFGLSAGSYVEFSSSGTVLETLQVSAVNRAINEVTFTTALTVAVAAGDTAVSKEYDLVIERLELGKVVEAEAFANLGLHPSHSRYGPKIVGSYNRSTLTSSISGESELVRLSDLSVADDGSTPGISDISNRASMLSAAVSRTLADGTDDLDNIDDTTYIGVASDDAAARSGIQSLANEESLSMVAVPGRTSVTLQKALITHCELLRYRFAVMETPRDSNMAVAVTHRQNFDTTRAAIYHPWLVVPDLFGERGDLLRIAPSGHVMGIYARTDTTRGVWKAPANEVVRGILQFESIITTGQQAILNPIHVNAFRDFRTANRGLRLWGGRTLSSDAEWKYVNVRRLFIYLEQSIERGTQFAVFEPNTESLWATVKQSISNFLISVWRDGGLEGVTAEEAFFVNVGYNVTMTQTDIDNGKLIVEVGVAPVKPAEFVIIRISQKTREATA